MIYMKCKLKQNDIQFKIKIEYKNKLFYIAVEQRSLVH